MEILAEDVQAGDPRKEAVMGRTKCFVRLFQFLPDGNALRAMLLALAAADALGGEGGVAREGDGNGVLEAARPFRFAEHCVVTAERRGDVDALRAGHAVLAAGAADFLLQLDLLFHLPEKGEVPLREVPGVCILFASLLLVRVKPFSDMKV